jgi:hypothetical protein
MGVEQPLTAQDRGLLTMRGGLVPSHDRGLVLGGERTTDRTRRAGSTRPDSSLPGDYLLLLTYASPVTPPEPTPITGVSHTNLTGRGLRWSDLDTGFLGLTVRQTVIEVASKEIPAKDRSCRYCGQEHVGLLFKGQKSRAGRRWVPLASPARKALRRHRSAQKAERKDFGEHYRDHDLVFCGPDGDPLRPGCVTAAFATHVTACGLPQIRLHDTRHRACSLLLAGGVPIEVVQMILGHSSPNVTRNVYPHLMRATTAAQVDTAAQLLTRHRP